MPLLPEIRAGGDAGEPIVVSSPDGAAAKVFRAIGEALLARATPKPAPAPGR